MKIELIVSEDEATSILNAIRSRISELKAMRAWVENEIVKDWATKQIKFLDTVIQTIEKQMKKELPYSGGHIKS